MEAKAARYRSLSLSLSHWPCASVSFFLGAAAKCNECSYSFMSAVMTFYIPHWTSDGDWNRACVMSMTTTETLVGSPRWCDQEKGQGGEPHLGSAAVDKCQW